MAMYQVPEQVLGSRLVRRGESVTSQVLIKWNGMSKELATWENEEVLRQQFPAAPAWGQAGAQVPGDVSNPANGVGTKMQRGKRARRPNARVIGLEWAE
jgi:hypothetical protein